MGDLVPFLEFVKMTECPTSVLKTEGENLIVVSSNQAFQDFLSKVDIDGKNVSDVYEEIIGDEQKDKLREFQNSIKRAKKLIKEEVVKLENVAINLPNNNSLITHLELSIIPLPIKNNTTYFIHQIKNISDSFRLEKKLYSQKQLMNHAEQISGFGTWELDLKSNKLTWSDGVYLICGYEPQSFEVTFEIGLKIIHPDDRKGAIEAMEETIASGREYKIQKRFLLEDGTIKPILSRGSLLHGLDGKPLKLIGVFQDLSDQEEIKKKVQDALDNFQALVENVDGIMWEADAKSLDFSFVSPQVFEILGYTPEEWIGETNFWINHIHPDDREQAYNYRKSMVKKGENHIFEYRMFKKSGEYIWVQDRVTVIIQNGKPDRLKGILVDINDRYFQRKLEQLEREVMEKSMEVNVSLKKVLSLQMKGIEEIFPEMTASILRVENSRLYNVSSPSLPISYVSAINGVLIGEMEGSCGTAAYTKEEVVVSDIQHDKRWENYKHLVTPFGYKSCWAKPIFNDKKDVVGTFAIYFKDQRVPRELEKIAIDRSHRLTSLIFERFIKLEQIKHVNQLHSFINKSTNEAIYEWDILNDKVYFGESFERFFGYSHKGDFKQKDWLKMIHPDDYEEVTQYFKSRLAISSVDKLYKEYRIIKNDGDVIFIETTGFVVRNEKDKPVRIVGVVRNISETKELKSLLDTASTIARIGGWEVDMRTKAIYWSPLTKEIHEIPEDFELDYNTALSFYKEKYRDSIDNILKESIEKRISFDFEFPIVTYNGRERWVRTMGKPEYLDETCIKISGSIQDIHDRKMAEKQIELHLHDLAKSNAELEQFAYIASHDLQEPLRMVTSFLALLEKKYHPILDEKGKTYISFAIDGATRMKNIILDLLEFSRVGRGLGEKTPIDLNEILSDVIKMQRQPIEESKAKINYETLPIVSSHRLLMVQVFQNLIGNALKYKNSSQIPEIEISVKSLKNHWQIAIKDNGIGISKEYHEKIFVIFQRLHNKDEYSGTGIGLAIVKKIIHNEGGEIWLESEEGIGSTFYFTLPK